MENVVFNGRFHDLVDDWGPQQVLDGLGFPEGPVMLPQGYLLFADIDNDAILRYSRPGRTGIFRQPSGGANGNTLDPQGRLVTCEGGVRRLTRTEHDGSITVLADSYQGKRLNSPNDVVVRTDGTIYFTDPIFLGSDEGMLSPDEQVMARSYMDLDFCGVFKVSPSGELSVLTKDLVRCNGLAFSPDERTLYVVNSADNSVYACDVDADGLVGNPRVWLRMEHEVFGLGDGMKVDVEGNAYVTGPGGVWVASSDGTPLGIIRIPVPPSNLAFYGFDAGMLFITAAPGAFMQRIKVPGISVIDRVE